MNGSAALETLAIGLVLKEVIPVATASYKSLRGSTSSRRQASQQPAGADVDLTPSASAGPSPASNGHQPAGPVVRQMQRVVHIDPATGRFTKADGTDKRTPAPV